MYLKKECDNKVCATCVGDSINCILSCNEGCGRCELDGKCMNNDCKVGYFYKTGGICEKCNTRCNKCLSNANNCSECSGFRIIAPGC